MNVLSRLIKLFPSKPVFAHCDIPCGIYDPEVAKLAAKTVLTMVQKISQLPKENPTVNDRNSFVRIQLTSRIGPYF